MILPDRKTIRPLIENQKYQSAKEGIALAEKVDALRKEFNELKKNREEFLQGTILEIEKATKHKSEVLNSLQGQIEALEAKRKELLKPLNANWKELELAKIYFEKQKKEFSQEQSKLEAIRQDSTEKGQKIALQVKKIGLLVQETERLNADSKKEKLQSEQIIRDAIANRDEIEKECSDRLVAVSERENKIEFREQGVENERKNLEELKQELNIKDRQLKDQYAQLAKTIEEVKKDERKRKNG